MSRIIAIVAMFLFMNSAVTIEPGDTPRTFRECVMSGGTVAVRDGEVTCRHVHTEVERIYGQMTLESGETEFVEIWAETDTVVVTYLLAPSRTAIGETKRSTLLCENADVHPECVTD